VSALLLIDVQQGMHDTRWGERNNPDAENNIAELLAAWRAAERPVIHVQHMSTEPNSAFAPGAPGNALQPGFAPRDGEPLFQKTVNSAFIGTDLESYLRENGIGELVVVGMTTDHCVSTTVRMAANLGFGVTIVDDATATFERVGHDGVRHTAQAMHQLALASLNDEFARVRPTRELLSD
jgi:nicotinamidase-related amidase